MENMDLELFNSVAKNRCKRWSEESLSMLKKHFVDGSSISSIARDHDKQQNTLSTMKSRFIKQVKKELIQAVDVDDFMLSVAPKKGLALFKTEIEKLNKSGYTIEQISEYLMSNQLDIGLDEIQDYIDKLGSENR
ncbi:MAG: hypothetical protein ACRBCS_15995 [Cellvibrionaceae bacterium]